MTVTVTTNLLNTKTCIVTDRLEKKTSFAILKKKAMIHCVDCFILVDKTNLYLKSVS